MDVGLSSLRFITVLMTLFWVQDLLAKDIERKSVLFVLAYPRHRSSFVLGQFLGIALLAACAVVIIGSLLWLLLWIGPSDHPQGTPVQLGWPYWASLLYLYLGVLVVAAFAVMIATLSTTPMLPMVLGVAFAIAATAIGPTYDYLQTSQYAEAEYQEELSKSLEYALWLLPDISRLDIRSWPLYGKMPDGAALWAGVATAAGYIALTLGIGVARFQRREFS
jgi:ABC-type transport system involved in multi-copper enzyme maturation permease subunit